MKLDNIMLDLIKKYMEKLTRKKVLKTMEEVEANTNETNLVAAPVIGELINDLMFPDGTKFYPDIQDGIRGYNMDAARGADTFVPFKMTADGELKIKTIFYDISSYNNYPYGNIQIVFENISCETLTISDISGRSGTSKTIAFNAGSAQTMIAQKYDISAYKAITIGILTKSVDYMSGYGAHTITFG